MTQRRALITGASEGIGRAFCLRLAKNGWTVTGVARNVERLASLEKELGQGGHQTLVADLATREGVATVTNELARAPYDLLINNAGFGLAGPFYLAEPAALTTMLRLNVEALVLLSHAYLRQARNGDALINVSSMLAFLPTPAFGAYAASKAFVTSFSDALWYEQKRRGVYVFGLCPGSTETEFHRRSGGKRPPAAVTQSADDVVSTALRALARRRRPTVISGAFNKIGALLSRVLSRRTMVAITGGAR